MDSREVHLRAYDVIEAALIAETINAAVVPMREELEVLSRDDLLRVAMAIAAETMVGLTPRGQRPKLLGRLEQRRLMAMVAD